MVCCSKFSPRNAIGVASPCCEGPELDGRHCLVTARSSSVSLGTANEEATCSDAAAFTGSLPGAPFDANPDTGKPGGAHDQRRSSPAAAQPSAVVLARGAEAVLAVLGTLWRSVLPPESAESATLRRSSAAFAPGFRITM